MDPLPSPWESIWCSSGSCARGSWFTRGITSWLSLRESLRHSSISAMRFSFSRLTAFPVLIFASDSRRESRCSLSKEKLRFLENSSLFSSWMLARKLLKGRLISKWTFACEEGSRSILGIPTCSLWPANALFSKLDCLWVDGWGVPNKFYRLVFFGCILKVSLLLMTLLRLLKDSNSMPAALRENGAQNKLFALTLLLQWTQTYWVFG